VPPDEIESCAEGRASFRLSLLSWRDIPDPDSAEPSCSDLTTPAQNSAARRRAGRRFYNRSMFRRNIKTRSSSPDPCSWNRALRSAKCTLVQLQCNSEPSRTRLSPNDGCSTGHGNAVDGVVMPDGALLVVAMRRRRYLSIITRVNGSRAILDSVRLIYCFHTQKPIAVLIANQSSAVRRDGNFLGPIFSSLP